MKIAILGWGSLIRDPRELAIIGDWQKGGPVLPIEFSRVSKDGRLTLVIDPKHGVAVTTLFAKSEFTDLNDAIANLREREDTATEKIGYINSLNNTERDYSRQEHPTACDTIKAWALANGWDAVIWTALTSNFVEKLKKPFAAAPAVAYVKMLPPEARAKAFEYIEKAPPVVDTPVRRLFADIKRRRLRRIQSPKAADILGHAPNVEPLPDAPKNVLPNSWHGKRKKRQNTYQIPGQTAADLRLGLGGGSNAL